MPVCLYTLGRVSLERDGCLVEGVAAQRRRVALLALLALAGDMGMPREKVLGYLWEERSPQRARHLLSEALSVLRRVLGEAAILTPGDTLRLDGSQLWTDVGEFGRRLAAGAETEAIELYGGPFLDGFYVEGAPEFERWLELRREELGRAYAGALESLAERASQRDPRAASALWTRLALHDPHNARVALRLIDALAAAGERVRALRHATTYATRLREELGVEPDPAIELRAEELRGAPLDAPPRVVEARLPGARAPAPPVAAPAAAAVLQATTSPTGTGTVVEGWPSTLPGDSVPSVAVLPLVNLSREPEDEVLSDGIAEQIIDTLSAIPALRVVARTSAFSFKGKSQDVREIGQELGASVIVEGSLRRAGGRVRVSARLLDARSGYQFRIWSREYERELLDVFAIQDDIARAVAAALAVTPVPGQGGSLATPHSAAAYELYLRGRYSVNRRMPADLRAGLRAFEEAVALWPGYAPAFAGMAQAHAVLGIYGDTAPGDAFRQARAAAERALELDDRLAEPHTTLGRIAAVHDHDFQRAAAHFREAMARLPGDPAPYHGMAVDCLLPLGRWDEAEVLLRQAADLDPLSPVIRVSRGLPAYFRRAPAEAIPCFQGALTHDASFGPAHYFLGLAHIELGEEEDALASLQQAAALGGRRAEIVAALGVACARRGDTPGAEAALAELRRAREGGYVSAGSFALVELALGRAEDALDSLERALADGAPELVWLGVRPGYDAVREHPRFRALLREVRLAS